MVRGRQKFLLGKTSARREELSIDSPFSVYSVKLLRRFGKFKIQDCRCSCTFPFYFAFYFSFSLQL